MQEGIFISNNESKIIYWNKGAEKLLGFSSQEILGTECSENHKLCQVDTHDTNLCLGDNCPLKKAIRQNRQQAHPNLVFMRAKDGEDIPVSVNTGPVTNADNKVVGAICVFRDMRSEYNQKILAGEIQKRMVSNEDFNKNGFFVETIYKPMEETGGDFQESFFTDEDYLYATIADATGHGISAALFTMVYKTLLHSSLTSNKLPSTLLKNINEGFSKTSSVEGYYMTACIIRIDPKTNKGKYASAGHPPALIFSKTPRGTRLKQVLEMRSFMIGTTEDPNYTGMDFKLEKDEFIVLASDGLFEAICENGQEFGLEGVIDFFERYKGTNYLEDLLFELQRRNKSSYLEDDLSILRIENCKD